MCGRGDWCGVSSDGTAAVCMRVESDRPVRNGGWLHRLTDATSYVVEREARRNPHDADPPRPDFDRLHRRYLADTSDARLEQFAVMLGLSTASLRRLGATWAAVHRAWAFPMRSPEGEVVGIRLRREDGYKWAVTGSRQGLFIPDGQPPDLANHMLFCEGPTDAAALLDVGLYAVGRPSCSGGHDLVMPLARGRDVVIIADRDEPKTRPDGSIWYPGQEGAERLAAGLFGKARTVKIIRPTMGKDARQWIAAGATAVTIRAAVGNAKYWRPTT
ncbi:MAG: hypothetical protein JXL80_05725 [Planctomycetes bacterium]|nr:hypothetical protein [Planctomycetota bacterium]